MAQTILVTGSTSGFGRLTVETLARQGYIVFAGMRAAAEELPLVTFVPKGEKNEQVK